MSPRSVNCAFPQNYSIFDEGEVVSEGLSDLENENDPPTEDHNIAKAASYYTNDINKKTNKRDARLAERTSEILSNYRAFLHEHDMETASRASTSTGASRGSLDPPEDGFRELHYYEHRIKHNLSSSNHGFGGNQATTRLLRDFSNADVPLGSCSSDDGIPEGKRRYKMPRRVRSGVLISGGLLAVILVVVVIEVSTRGNKQHEIPGIQNTPGWHSEAAYILEHEDGHEEDMLPHFTMIDDPGKEPYKAQLESKPLPEPEPEPEPIKIGDLPSYQILEPALEADMPEVVDAVPMEIETEPEVPPTQIQVTPVKSSESVESIQTETEINVVVSEETENDPENDPENDEDSTKPDIEQDIKTDSSVESDTSEPEDLKSIIESTNANHAVATSSLASFDLGKILHDKFKPLWLGPREGWNGGSHDEAMQFCKNIRGKELCPYSAMCPYGPGHNVMAGRKPVDFSGQEQYAPVYGHSNRWVMVGQKDGDPSTTCKSHEQLELRPPAWGLNSDKKELKQHIMCCTLPNQ